MGENVQKALHRMKQLGDELEYIATSPLQAKFKLMLIMVYVDIFSQIWSDSIIKSGRRRQRKVFSSWSDKFIFTRRNDYYASHEDEFHLLDGDKFYKIRNALLHFGGLPNFGKLPVFISACTREDFSRKYSQELGGREALVLCPTVLSVAIAIAIADTLELVDESDDDEQDRIMAGISQRVQNESALPIK